MLKILIIHFVFKGLGLLHRISTFSCVSGLLIQEGRADGDCNKWQRAAAKRKEFHDWMDDSNTDFQVRRREDNLLNERGLLFGSVVQPKIVQERETGEMVRCCIGLYEIISELSIKYQ